MSEKVIRVGIVGADNKASWAKISHIPAIKGLPGMKLAAVATRNEQSAREAAEAFGADRWFADPFSMILDDQIDVITIAVNVPAHRVLVLAALDAYKAVYCETPLGCTVAEASEMLRAVHLHHTAIGLQGRLNPAVRRAAELVSSGKIGQPLNARVVSTTVGLGSSTPSRHDLFSRVSSGANFLTITAGHTLDVVEAVLGPIAEVDARTQMKWPRGELMDTGERSLRETYDHVGVLGLTHDGVAFTADIGGGVAPECAYFSLEVRGTEGWLTLTGNHPDGCQAGDLKLTSSVAFIDPDEAAIHGGIMDASLNVAEVYTSLSSDIREGTYDTPGFDLALHNACLIEAVALAAEGGERQRIKT